MKKDLYLMRHGQTLFNIRNKIQGWCDSPLTPLGISQAKQAGEKLKHIPFDHYYCSTAERSSDTLELIIAPSQPYTRLKGLKERYFGTFEGESEDLNPHFENFDYDDLFPHYGGETKQQVQNRLYQTLKQIMDQEDTKTVLAVSHCGTCYAFLSLLGDPQVLLDGKKINNCAILHFTYDNQTFQFKELIEIC